MPVSTSATTMPWPRAPKSCQTFLAPMNGTLVSLSFCTMETGCTERTSLRCAICEAASGERVAEKPSINVS